uniref:Uncharacterized protein n=1 Tax=Avena sativa TaxID=4498 RepID=A0ACD5UKS8_AVESA
MRFACFGGAAAVADEAVVAVARHRRRGKFFFGSRSPSRSKASSSPETKTNKRVTSPGRRRETDFDIYDMMVAAGKPSLSTAASLDSAYSSSSSSSSSSCSSSRSSSSSSLSSLLDATPPQPARKQRLRQPDEHRRSPALGAAAVLVCLVMLIFGDRLAATLLTAAVLCFFPRQCPAAHRPAASSPERPAAASRREAVDTKAVEDGFLARNRKKRSIFRISP